jgi:AsmA protein
LNATTESSVALVLAAHGDRGGSSRNEGLAAHVAALAGANRYASVSGGVLNGEPSLEAALAHADASGATQVIIYPMFMSVGYFVKTVLAERVSAAGLKTPTGILQPLGLDKRVPLLMLESALRGVKSAELDPATARLLVAGHGSKHGPENADSTKRAARSLAPHSPFARIETAFLEEQPFIADALENYSGTSVVAGFFSGDGLHASNDIPEAIKQSGARALYTGPIGLHPRIPELIASSVHSALAEPESDASEKISPAPTTAPIPATAPAAPSAQPGIPVAEAPEPQTTVDEAPVKRSKKRSRGPVKFLLKAAFTIVMMAVLALGAIAFLVPQDVVRDQVSSLVKEQTGRDLTVGGKTSFSLFPNIGVELEDVSISNPPGMKSGEMLHMGSLNLNLKLLPLLTRRVEVDRFVLVKPVFNLLVDAEGRKNWDMEKKAAGLNPSDQVPTNFQRAAIPPKMIFAQAGGLGGGTVQEISLGTAKIIDGTLNYTDELTGAKQRVDKMNVTLVQTDLSEPLDAEGNLVWQGEKVSFDGRLENVSALLKNAPAKARINLTTRHIKGNFDGQVTLGKALAANGAISGDTPSLRSLARWLGSDLPPGGGLGPVAITGNLGLAGQTVTFTKAKLGLDGMTGKGQVSLRLKGVRPHVTASLAFDKLDLNPYLLDASATPSPTAIRPAKKRLTPAAKTATPELKQGANESLTDFIERLNKSESGKGAPRPQVQAWNQRAIDVTGLRSVDADVKLTTGALYYKKIKTGRSELAATLKSGVLTANLTKLALYSGTGVGKVTVNGARAVPAISALFNLNSISALPLLKDATGFKWISGRANMSIDVSGTGRSQSELMRSLKGKSRLVFSNGAIEGINIPAMVRKLKQGQFGGLNSSQREKTDFSSLTGSFIIQDGIAYNKDLNLIGPLIRLTGEGNADLGRERIDYAALPRVVGTLQGQGANDDKKGIAIPVRITGPWAKPKIVPDLQRLLNDPELAKDAVNKLGKVFKKLKKKEDVNKLLQGVLGGGNQGSAGGAQPQGQQAKPEDVLKKLFQ